MIGRLRAAGCVFAADEAELLLAAASDGSDLDRLVAARVAGAPLEHVLGWAEFCGRRVRVGPGVFVPRRRSELLVQIAAERLTAADVGPAVVVDLCCGSGAIGAAIGAAIASGSGAGRPVEVWATDLDPTAVACARDNLDGIGVALVGDLFDPLPATLRGRVDLVVASAPYVPTDAIRLLPPEARLHEPRRALDGGSDGLAVYRRLVPPAPDWLRAGGSLAVETSADQAAEVAALVTAAGLVAEVVSDARDSTVVLGRLSGSAPG